MEFGHWIQQHRTQTLKIDVRTAAKQTGVDGSTISRIENVRTQPTLATVIRLCEGYELALRDMIAALVGPEVAATLDVPPADRVGAVLSLADTVAFVRQVGADESVRAWLAAGLSRVAAQQARADGETPPPDLSAADIGKLLAQSAVYQFTLAYPAGLPTAALIQVYRSGGVMTFQDVGAFVRAVRQSSSTTLAALENQTSSSASVLSRIETGTLERIKLGDVLALNQSLTPDDNRVLAMFWRAAQTHDALGFQVLLDDRPVKAIDIAEILVILFRWVQQLGLNEAEWLAGLRSVLGKNQ